MRFRLLLSIAATLAPVPAHAGEQDAAMARLALDSPRYQSARREVAQAAAGLRDRTLRRLTQTALLTRGDCIHHRIALTPQRQDQILSLLTEHGLLAPDARDARERLFPRLEGEGGACPHLATPVLAAPGGNSGSHHSWPGGLAVHVATNLASGRALMRAYGMRDTDAPVAAILWHDWAKALLLGWRADGSTAPELQIAGTGAHHVLGLAEAMRRGVDPRAVAAQACAHDADPAKTSQWIAAAAIIADVDPAPYRTAASPECLVTHMADQNWIFGDAAIEAADAWLAAEAPRFGHDPRDTARYRLGFRNPVLARIGAEALFLAPVSRRRRLVAAAFPSPVPLKKEYR